MMKEQNKPAVETANTNPSVEEGKERWVFIPVYKKLVLKRTDTYLLIRVRDASAIISTKFLRKKESENYIYLSVPPTYDVQLRVREYDGSKWQTTKEFNLNAQQLAPVIKQFNVEYSAKEEPQESLPF